MAKKQVMTKKPGQKQATVKKPDLKETNFKKLARTSVLVNFVKKNNGAWDHQGWLSLLASLKDKGYDPVDADQVGVLLEQKKAQYLAGK
jgi:hypothetical protein